MRQLEFRQDTEHQKLEYGQIESTLFPLAASGIASAGGWRVSIPKESDLAPLECMETRTLTQHEMTPSPHQEITALRDACFPGYLF